MMSAPRGNRVVPSRSKTFPPEMGGYPFGTLENEEERWPRI
jgi:hypothetical protein